jgi:hypothetical protein
VGVPVIAAAALFLFWLTKVLKIANPSYKKSLVISAVFFVFYNSIRLVPLWLHVVLTMRVGLIVESIIVAIPLFFIFHFLLRKLYFVTWKQSLVIFILFAIPVFVVLFFGYRWFFSLF